MATFNVIKEPPQNIETAIINKFGRFIVVSHFVYGTITDKQTGSNKSSVIFVITGVTSNNFCYNLVLGKGYLSLQFVLGWNIPFDLCALKILQ